MNFCLGSNFSTIFLFATLYFGQVYLIDRLRTLADKERSTIDSPPERHRFSQIQALGERLKSDRESQARAAAKQERSRVLNALAGKEEESWSKAIDFVELKQAKAYDEATIILKDLRDLAESQGMLPQFRERFNKLKLTYKSRSALMTRWRKIKV